MSAGRAQLLYDADCGFCRWSLGWVLRWDRGRALQPVALQDPRARGLLGAIDAERRMASWHLVGADGSVASAGAAAPPLLRLLPAGASLAWLLARAPALSERAYARVAGARGRLGARLTPAAIARADRLIAARQAAQAGDPLP
ncbi:MAG TPA: DCC1-like thiol-disulfide oxidoreductase family protein [Solirubrobacterales bacterium]